MQPSSSIHVVHARVARIGGISSLPLAFALARCQLPVVMVCTPQTTSLMSVAADLFVETEPLLSHSSTNCSSMRMIRRCLDSMKKRDSRTLRQLKIFGLMQSFCGSLVVESRLTQALPEDGRRTRLARFVVSGPELVVELNDPARFNPETH